MRKLKQFIPDKLGSGANRQILRERFSSSRITGLIHYPRHRYPLLRPISISWIGLATVLALVQCHLGNAAGLPAMKHAVTHHSALSVFLDIHHHAHVFNSPGAEKQVIRSEILVVPPPLAKKHYRSRLDQV